MANATIAPGASREEWTQAGGKAGDAAAAAGEMASHAASAVGAMARQAVTGVGKQADDLTARAGSEIEHLGDLLSENTPHDGMLGTASQAVAHSVQRGGQYLEEAKLSGTSAMITELVRQHPVAAIFAGFAAGFLVSRVLRD